MRRSWAMPSLSSVSAACRIVSQSDWLPMMMPTAGCVSPIAASLSAAESAHYRSGRRAGKPPRDAGRTAAPSFAPDHGCHDAQVDITCGREVSCTVRWSRDLLRGRFLDILRRSSDPGRLALVLMDIQNTKPVRGAASMVYFDINSLKQINERISHAAGDAALLQVARILVENVRNSDVVGRLGGDELGVLLVQADQELAEQKAAQLAAAVAAQPLQWQGQSIPLGVSYRVYSFNGGENARDAIDAPDPPLY